jgi:hypothetical protein
MILDEPVIEPMTNAGVTATDRIPEDEPHELLKVTFTLPDTADAPQVVVMELVPCPAVMVTPVGTVQV